MADYQDSIFWVEVDKIKPNPFQPRREFNEDRLRDLADSIRQYGVLQPLVVTRKEVERPDGGLVAEYELIAGERRLRASQIAGLREVPAVIKSGEQTDKMKLELAIIENLQREDLNPIERAQAFHQLVNEFNLKHYEVAKRVGRSREYVSNTIRLLALPQEVLDAVVSRKITEGHAKPILMLIDRPEEQITLFKEILAKRLTVRETENLARRAAYDKVRKKDTFISPEILEIENQLTEQYGTRVKVEPKENGGRVSIDYFSEEDLLRVLELLSRERRAAEAASGLTDSELIAGDALPPDPLKPEEDDDLYFIKNFSV
jgi:ParB family chromosome partitioning protein